jgi:hypothetical protein
MRRDAKAALEFQDNGSNDELITEKEDRVFTQNQDWLHSIDRITQREAHVDVEEILTMKLKQSQTTEVMHAKYTCYIAMFKYFKCM